MKEFIFIYGLMAVAIIWVIVFINLVLRNRFLRRERDKLFDENVRLIEEFYERGLRKD